LRVACVTADNETLVGKCTHRDNRSFRKRIAFLECHELTLADDDFHNEVLILGQIPIERDQHSPLAQRLHRCGLCDVKQYDLDVAKGATDMVRMWDRIRRVQQLLGHANVSTTEIYINGLLPTTVRPNETPIIASVK
jgi:integrase